MIDVHAHFWPAGLLEAHATGRSWWGVEPVVLADGRRVLAIGDRLVRFAPPDVDLADLDARIERRRDEEGVDVELLQPVGFLWGEHLHGDDLAGMVEEVAAELGAAQRARPDAVVGVGLVPLHDPNVVDRALDAAVAAGLGVVAVPTNARGRNLDDPTVAPLLERALERDLAVVVHPTYLHPAAPDRFPRHYFANSFGAPLDAALAALSLAHGGVLDRHPTARVLVVNGAGCAPGEIGRFDRRWHEREDVRSMPLPPSAYLDRLYYDTLVLDEATLRLLVERVGSDRVAIGTDHPFRSDVPQGASAWVDAMDWLDDAQRDDLRGGTARAFLRRSDLGSRGAHA